MTSFSEKTVRGISLLFLVIFGFLTYKNYVQYVSGILVILPFKTARGGQLIPDVGDHDPPDLPSSRKDQPSAREDRLNRGR